MKWLVPAFLTLGVAVLHRAGSPTLEASSAAVAKAGGATLQVRVTEVGGTAEAHTLVLGAPRTFRLDSPGTLKVSDGEWLYVLNKAKKTYSKSPLPKSGLAGVLGEPFWPWLAASDPSALASVRAEKRGATRRIGGQAVQEVALDRGDQPPLTLFVDPANGLVKGCAYRTAAGKEFVVQATEAKLGAVPAIVWTPPTDATLEVVPVVKKLTFADVKPVFDAHCVRCHSGDRAPRGLHLDSYEGVSQGVVAGQPDSSRIVNAVAGGRMPPNEPLGQAEVERIAKWVEDGAQR